MRDIFPKRLRRSHPQGWNSRSYGLTADRHLRILGDMAQERSNNVQINVECTVVTWPLNINALNNSNEGDVKCLLKHNSCAEVRKCLFEFLCVLLRDAFLEYLGQRLHELLRLERHDIV